MHSRTWLQILQSLSSCAVHTYDHCAVRYPGSLGAGRTREDNRRRTSQLTGHRPQTAIPANCLDRAYVIVIGRVESPVLIPGEYPESLGPACLHVCITATESSYVGLNQLVSARRVQNNRDSYATCYPTTWERTTSSFVSISRETITPVRSSRRLQATYKIPQASDDVWRYDRQRLPEED